MKHIPLLALMGLLALPVTGTLQAQQPNETTHVHADSGRHFGARGGMHGMRGMRGGFAGRLLAQRNELNLTDRQVSQLSEIQRKYQERNRALMTEARGARTDADRERMQAERKATRERMQAEREEYLKAHPEVRKSMDQLRENREHERKDVEGVLTAEQKATLQQRMEQAQRPGKKLGRAWVRDSVPAKR
jgi:Spy/CpxP family protein refolding chaperone